MSEQIIIDTKYAEAHVYYDFINAKNQHVYLVKVSLTDVGIHINSITVQPSSKDPNSPWVQSPRFNIKGKWIWPLQMEKAKQLWPLIEELALKAVADFSQGKGEARGSADIDTAFFKKENEFL